MGNWHNISEIVSKRYQCGYCDSVVGSDRGFAYVNSRYEYDVKVIYICPHCSAPTYFKNDYQIPGVRFGTSVEHVPGDIRKLYEEARSCTEVNAYTASVLACRKLLMNIAVSLGANEGLKFYQYVDYLLTNGHIPQGSKEWVDIIRTKGNEATHEINLMLDSDAANLIKFVEMLLRIIYEYPEKAKALTP